MGEASQHPPFGEVAAWLDRLLTRHPRFDSDGVLELRANFLRDRGMVQQDRSEKLQIRTRAEAAQTLRDLRESFFERGPKDFEGQLERLDLTRLPDLRASAERLRLDEALRDSYAAMQGDSKIDPKIVRLLVDNVVLPWRERRRELADFLTERQVSARTSPRLTRRARNGAKRVSNHYAELESLHGWWLREMAHLPRWNPLLGLLLVLRSWALNYALFFILLLCLLVLFTGGAVAHGFLLQLIQGSAGGPQ